MANGQAIGSIVGGIGGGIVAGPPGAMIGSQLGGAAGGLFDSISSGNKANQSAPLREDPNQVSRLREIEQTKRQIAQGTDPLTQARIGQVQQLGETTKGQVAKFTGGEVGGTINALLRAQRNIGTGVNQAFTQSQQRLPFFENLQTQLGNRIAQRKLELDIHEQDFARAQQAAANRGLFQSIGGLVGNIGQGGAQAGQPSLSTPGFIGGGGGPNSLGGFSPNMGQTFQQGISGGGGIGSGFGGFGG